MLDGRKQVETDTSFAGSHGSNVPAEGTEAPSSERPRPVPPERDSLGPSARQGPEAGTPLPSSPALPLSQEEASSVRRPARNGLILILASYGLWTMEGIVGSLGQSGKLGSFIPEDVGFGLACFAGIGGLVTAVLGSLLRVRGLGQHPVWAIVAPLFCGNIIVIEALPNRYEPESDRRGLRVTIGIFGALAW